MASIKGALFDLDGTLLDSMGVWKEIDQRFFAKRGMIMPDDYVDAIKPMEFIEIAKYTIERFHLFETPQQLMDEWNDMAHEAYASWIEMKPGAKVFLHTLYQKGMPMGVVTSSHETLFKAALKHHQIEHLFTSVTTVKEVSKSKHHADIYLIAAQKLGVSPEQCVVFEDILVGIRSAKKAGFKTVAVSDASAIYEREDIKKEADLYIEDFTELQKSPII